MSLDLDRDPTSPSAPIALRRGPRVTLRAARPRDLEGLRALAGKAGLIVEDLELARLVRSAPASRLVLCATAWVDGSETVLGIGVIELGSVVTMPTLLLVDAELTDGLHEVLAEALLDQARQLAGSQVA